jgi:hypothetical protein
MGTTCPEGQLTVQQSCLAVLLPADILKPENKRFFEKRWAKWRVGREYLP